MCVESFYVFAGECGPPIVTTRLTQSSVGDEEITTPVSETSNPSTSDVLKDLFNQKKQSFISKLSSIDTEVNLWKLKKI